MKLQIEELMFLIQAAKHATIKGGDALLVAELISKLEKNYKKQEASLKESE
jgi:hypothetical protein